MSAKEQFEKLGYECEKSYTQILYFKYTDSEKFGAEQWEITFDWETEKIVTKDMRQAGFSMKYCGSDIYLDEFKAIQKQIEELGW